MIVEVQVSLQDVISGWVDKYFFHVTLEWWFLKPPRHARTSALWLPVIAEFISVPRRSASSFNSNTVRSGDELPQFGWVWSNLRMHNTDAQVSGLLTPSMWCLNTKHVMGWDEDASRASWQTNSFENMVSFIIVLLLPRRINWLRLVTYILGECVLAKWSCIFPKPGKLVSSNM